MRLAMKKTKLSRGFTERERTDCDNRCSVKPPVGILAVADCAPDDLPFAAAEVARELVRWLRHLATERRLSPKTQEAYRRDVLQFLSFLAEHLGGPITLAALSALAPRDVRACLSLGVWDPVAGELVRCDAADALVRARRDASGDPLRGTV